MAGAGAPGQRGAGNLAQALRWLSLALVPALVLLFVYDRSFEVTPATAGLQHGGPVHAGAGFIAQPPPADAAAGEEPADGDAGDDDDDDDLGEGEAPQRDVDAGAIEKEGASGATEEAEAEGAIDQEGEVDDAEELAPPVSSSRSPSESASGTSAPSGSPSASGTAAPSGSPSASGASAPSGSPSASGTAAPSGSPSASETAAPSGSPSASGASAPSGSPSASGTTAPSSPPSASVTAQAATSSIGPSPSSSGSQPPTAPEPSIVADVSDVLRYVDGRHARSVLWVRAFAGVEGVLNTVLLPSLRFFWPPHRFGRVYLVLDAGSAADSDMAQRLLARWGGEELRKDATGAWVVTSAQLPAERFVPAGEAGRQLRGGAGTRTGGRNASAAGGRQLPDEIEQGRSHLNDPLLTIAYCQTPGVPGFGG